VVVGWFARVDLAEVAASRALRASDEEGRLAVLPALEDVRAGCLLTHRMESFAGDKFLQLPVLRSHPCFRFDPVRLFLDRCLGVPNLQAEQLAPVARQLWRRAAPARAHAASS